MKKVLSYILMASVLLVVSCADGKQQAIGLGNRFMNSYLVDVDFGALFRYSTGDAAKKLQETYGKLGDDGVADMREKAKEAKVKYVLNDKISFFSKSRAILVYEVRVGPDYTDKYVMTLELLGSRGMWRIISYSI